MSTAQVSLNQDKTLATSVAVPRSRYFVFAAVSILGCVADLVTKSLVFAWLKLPGGETYWLIKDYVGIQTAVNQGALFGLGQGFSALFALLSVGAGIGVVTWLFYYGAAKDWLLTLSLASVMGGIAGNLYDRLGLWHDAAINPLFKNGVRDWILFQHPSLGTWPNFNIADCLLVCGAIALMYHALVRPKESTTS